MNGRDLGQRYRRAHDRMRDVEGLLPPEAFDELLKFLFVKDCVERGGGDADFRDGSADAPPAAAIRTLFSRALRSRAPWACDIWQDGHFHLSDSTLLDLHEMFSDFRLADLSVDVRATALRTFLDSDARRGLGVFLTPEDVVRAMVDVLAPRHTELVLDPACGSGTFLLETVRHLSRRAPGGSPFTVHGVDKNPRMLLLAQLNLGNDPGIEFKQACTDSLKALGNSATPPLNLFPDSVDVILTNPPFGVTVTTETVPRALFRGGLAGAKPKGSRIPSEFLFVERCLRMLKHGGRLGIVLPRSVFTNDRMAAQRQRIDELGYLTELVELPPETFALTGTHTSTVAAFFRRHSAAADRRRTKAVVRACTVTNVGFDSTGRRREGNQLPTLARRLVEGETRKSPRIRFHRDVPIEATLQRSAVLLFSRNGRRPGNVLRDFVEIANTGRTPARTEYTDSGTFIVKVGNLTGRGIDWRPRDRNFVSASEGARRSRSAKLSLSRGDLVLTSSAHVARYIAKKVDIIGDIPREYRQITFAGEVTRLRPMPKIDSFVLLATLRHPAVRQDLQASVRGQTAHLHPDDLLCVGVPCDLSKPGEELLALAELLRREAELAFRLAAVAAEAEGRLASACVP